MKKRMDRTGWMVLLTLFAFASVVIPIIPPAKAGAAPANSFTEVIVEDEATAPEDPFMKIAGDLDRDGYDDLIVGGNANAPLVWYEGPNWVKHEIVSSGRFTTDGKLGDIDNDGDTDIILTYGSSSSSVRWYENPGDPTQSGWAMHTISARDAHDVLVHDMDGDNKLDVIVRSHSAFGDDGTVVYVYKQNTPVSWSEFSLVSPNGEGVRAADADADGDLDIITNGVWFSNPGVISSDWTQHTFSDTWAYPHAAISFGDINNDGRGDITLSPSETDGNFYRISWFEAPVDRTGLWTEHVVLDNAEAVMHFNEVVDFNLDGHLDIVSAEMSQSAGDDEVFVMFNQGAGASWEKVVLSTNGSHNVRVLDANNDGYPDLFGANWRDNGRDEHVKLWLNNGAPQLPTDQWVRHEIDGALPWPALFANADDLNGDGRKDIVAGGAWYEQPANVSNAWSKHEYGTTTGSIRNAALVDDFDNDGSPDIFGSNGTPYGARMFWARNDGSGTFTTYDSVVPDFDGDFPQGVAQIGGNIYTSWHAGGSGVQAYTVPADPVNQPWGMSQASGSSQDEALTAGDIDNDGDQDLWQGTKWLRNNGNGTWTQFTANPVGNKPDRSRLVDFNGDGYLDAVVGFESTGADADLIWLQNPGGDATGAWTLHAIADASNFGQVGGGYSMNVADFNGDGEMDVVLGEHKGQTRVLIFENQGNGASWTQQVVDGGGAGIDHHDGTVPVDIDNDGDLDIISIGYFNPKVWLFENKALEPAAEPQPDVIDVWHGNSQTFGDKGTPQNWVNVLGTVDSTVTDLSYTLNGGAPVNLSIGPDNRRLARAGDFNIDLNIASLNPGTNTVVITAVDSAEGTLTETVTVNYQDGNVWTLPYTADWSTTTQITNLAQEVDGPWTLTANGLRSSAPGYDRLTLIGDVSWTDYEVTVPITINGVDFDGASATGNSGSPAVGLMMRWQGHTDSPIAGWQPKVGWNPQGEIGWWRWNSDQSTARLEYYQQNQTPWTPQTGVTYMMKQRVETQADGTSLYRMKVWEQGQPEPSAWSLTHHETDTAGHLASGSLGLIAHHVDATYGNVLVTDLANPDTTAPVISNVTAENITENSATVAWDTDEPADSRVEYGTDANYGSSTTLAPGLVTGHSQNLTGLAANTTYHYRVISTDASGNQTVSPDQTFTTPAPDTTAPVISNAASSNVTASSATITWDTDEPADSRVEYGTSTSYGNTSPLDSTMTTTHSVGLSGLMPETEYHYRVISKDGAGNETVSSDFTLITAALPPSLEAHWKLDETSGTTASDSSGYGRNGTLQQGASFAAGQTGNALNLDGNDDYVDVAPFDVTGQELTISTWIKPESFVGKNRDNRIVSKATGTAEQDHYWMLTTYRKSTYETVLRFRLKTNGTTTTLIASSGNIPLDQWSHAAATYDGSTMRLYLNGVEVGSTAKTGNLSTNGAVGVNIGRNPDGYGEWDGMIDDMRIYSRTLSGGELQQLFMAQ